MTDDVKILDQHDAPLQVFEVTRYRCPVHGDDVPTIDSNIPDHDGHWCQLCALAQLDALGVHRVEEIKDDPATEDKT